MGAKEEQRTDGFGAEPLPLSRFRNGVVPIRGTEQPNDEIWSELELGFRKEGGPLCEMSIGDLVGRLALRTEVDELALGVGDEGLVGSAVEDAKGSDLLLRFTEAE